MRMFNTMRMFSGLFVASLLRVSLVPCECFKSFINRITDLPGLSFTANFSQYAGYVQANPEATKFLHFWYVESQADPKTDPVLLWLQGGPGCSSIEGLLAENGPFRVADMTGETLVENKFSWNKNANVLYLEAPVGVGYSFSTDGSTTLNDEQTANENYYAIKEFFKLKPALRTNDFFIAGESYGGVYIPMLAVRVLEGLSTFPLKFKGVAIGNGYLNGELLMSTYVQFFYGHGFIDENLYRAVEEKCCSNCDDTCDFWHQQYNGTKECQKMVGDMQSAAGYPNSYAIFSFCPHSFDLLWDESSIQHRYLQTINPKVLEFRQKMFQKARSAPRSGQNGTFDTSDPCCINDNGITAYMNKTAVRQALFVPPNIPFDWAECASIKYRGNHSDMTPELREILKAEGVRVLIYNGDADSMCNFIGDAQFTKNLGIKLKTPKSIWLYGDLQEVRGTVTRYGENGKLDFVTVLGAGHMVPACRPAAALQMINSFIAGKPYSASAGP